MQKTTTNFKYRNGHDNFWLGRIYKSGPPIGFFNCKSIILLLFSPWTGELVVFGCPISMLYTVRTWFLFFQQRARRRRKAAWWWFVAQRALPTEKHNKLPYIRRRQIKCAEDKTFCCDERIRPPHFRYSSRNNTYVEIVLKYVMLNIFDQ